MTREERDLVIKDLCGRLPYGVKVRILVHKDDPSSEETLVFNGFDGSSEYVFWAHDEEKLAKYGCRGRGYHVSEVKPYLRPMSYMTEAERKEYRQLIFRTGFADYHVTSCDIIDWLNKKMFDFRHLIPKGFARVAPEGMYS